MIDLKQPEIQFALEAVQQASWLVRHIQAEMVTPALTKNDRSPVTVADFAAQALVAQILSQRFPQDPLVAEENASALRDPEEATTLQQVTRFVQRFLPQATPDLVCNWIDRGSAEQARRFWTLDPIDGTKGFLRGDQYVVALAWIVDGNVELGVLGCPNLRGGYLPDLGGPGSLVVAQRGGGTWVLALESGQPFQESDLSQLHVSNCQTASQARLLRSFESGHTNIDQIDQLVQALGIQVEPVRMDSQAKYAILAAGEGEILVRLLSPDQPNYREKIWDQAAGSLVVEEAGGKISDLTGKPLDFSTGRTLKNNRGVLATNGSLHGEILKAIKAVDA